MQELGKVNYKTNVILNELQKDVNFNINSKLIFIDSCQFLSSLLESLVKNLDKDDFKYPSQEIDRKLIDLDKQKLFYAYE